MILDELVLENVGTFSGRHVIPLTPPSPSRPIVLIGGLNGAGKTTVLEAIQLALYGSLAQTSRRRSSSYDTYLGSLVHRGVPATKGAAVELTFTAFQEGGSREFKIKRSWRNPGGAFRELLVVWVDGRYDEALTSTWSEHVETFLPRGIAGLFFFDGEQIEALADLERSRQVLGSALAALLGLDLVDRLTTDLSVLRRRHRNRQIPDELRAAVESRQSAATVIRQTEQSAHEVAAAARNAAERAQKRLFHVKERYRAAGGDLLDQRESAETKVALVREQLSAVENELRDEGAGAAPFLMVSDLVSRMARHAQAEMSALREQIVIAAVAERDREVVGRLKSSKVPAKVVSGIQGFMAADLAARRISSEVEVVTGLRDTADVEALEKALLPLATKRLKTLAEERTTLRSTLDQAERVLVAIPDPEALAPLRQELDEAQDDLVKGQAAFDHADERLGALRHERARADEAYELAMDKAAQANLAADDERRLVDHVDRVRQTLEALRGAAAKKHLGEIADLILEALGRLLRKDQLVQSVTIDAETNTVALTGLDGKTLPADELSAGERQLLAVALLWGLARASGQPLPVVIDTPLGRLDGSHRGRLLDRYFPHASHQVILLSTDTEIDEAAYDRIRNHVGRSYRLQFDPSVNATSVVPGYFWN